MYLLDILIKGDLDFVKVKTNELALKSKRTYVFLNYVLQNLSKGALHLFIALQNLSKKKNLTNQKSDKVNSVVSVDRQDDIKKMDILRDQKRFTTVNL